MRQPAPQMHVRQPYHAVGLIAKQRTEGPRLERHGTSTHFPGWIRPSGQHVHQELDLSVYHSIRFAQPLLYGDAVLGKGNGDGNIALASTQTEAAAQRRGLVSFLLRIAEELDDAGEYGGWNLTR
ncbi:MAG: hypothetical protein IIC88_04295 [Chloroflexi bacterium]|nr:hypothetical protein [Chloroflexota bacterium]